MDPISFWGYWQTTILEGLASRALCNEPTMKRLFSLLRREKEGGGRKHNNITSCQVSADCLQASG